MLWQKDEKNEDKGVVMYASRMLTATEKKYHAYEKEALALVWSLDIFRHYLCKKFKVVTDCRSLTYLVKNLANTRIARWILRLQEFDFVIQHRAGRLSSDCDGLTRQPLESVAPYGEEPIEPIYEDVPHSSVFVNTVDEITTILPVSTRKRNGTVVELPATQEKKRKEPRKEPQKAQEAPPQEAPPQEVPPRGGLDYKHAPVVVEPRNSEEKAFFNCKKDLQGWDLATWLKEQKDP